MKKLVVNTAALAAGVALLAGCGGGSSAHHVSGKVVNTSYSAAQHGWVVKPVKKTTCSTVTKKVKHTSGYGKKKRTYYSYNKVKSCHTSTVGSKRVWTTTSAAKYRVQLKNGKWYCVTSSVYHAAPYRKTSSFVPTGYGRFC